MPSFEQEVSNNQIIINVTVTVGANDPFRSFQALLDTGSQRTLVSQRVVQDLGLKPIGLTNLIGITGIPAETYEYNVRIDIPIQVTVAHSQDSQHILMGSQLDVARLPAQARTDDYDVILGMDFLGLFHITMFRNRIILSN